MSSAGIKNWHWRTKGVEGWAKDWFTANLVGTEAAGVSIEAVTDVEGDAEVGMRKSKLVTIYDQKITMTWVAGEAKGTLIAMEVSHDMDEDEYQFEAALTAGSGKEADAAKLVAKRALADKLRPKFQQFPKDMLATHGRDLLAADEAASAALGSDVDAPATKTPSSAAAASSASASTSSATKDAPFKMNTAAIKVDDTFQCTAADLFEFLTDPAKIPLWSRNPATMKAEVGAAMSLFGGNIEGEVTKVDKPTLLETTWRAPTWPAGHFGTLVTRLVQGESSTQLTLKMTGVPVGKEEETEANLQRFYTSALKQIGFVSVHSSSHPPTRRPPTAGAKPPAPRRKPKKPPPTSVWTYVGNGAVFMGSFGLLVALGAGLYYGPTGQGAKVASA